MPRIEWDAQGQKRFETGTKKGVLYPISDTGAYNKGVAWNGLTGVTESPSGAEPTDLYADDIKYASMRSAETYSATIEAYTYPDEFAACNGEAEIADGIIIGQQARKVFGFSYVTTIGNDIKGTDAGYKIHLVYGLTASPSEKGYQTINDSPDAVTFSWEAESTPVNVAGYKPTSAITIDSTKVDADKLAALEDVLYGSTETDARLPLPDEVKSIMTAAG